MTDDALKALERRRYSLGGFLRRVDKKVLVAGLAAVGIFYYLYSTGAISKNGAIGVGVVVLVLWFILGSRERVYDIVPIEQAIPVLEAKLKMINRLTDKDAEVKISNVFILYHWNGVPKSYDVYWSAIIDKQDKKYVTEIDAMKLYLIKTRIAPQGWNADKPTNTEIKYRYVSDDLLYKRHQGVLK